MSKPGHRTSDTRDKTYATEQRLNALVDYLGAMFYPNGSDPTQVEFAQSWLEFPDQPLSGPGTPGAGAKLWASGGNLMATCEDGGDYTLGRQVSRTSGAQTVNSTTITALTGLSGSIAAGTYLFRAHVIFQGLVTDAAAYAYCNMGGTATVSGFGASVVWLTGSALSVKRQDTWGSNTGLNSMAMTNGQVYTCDLDGHVVVTGGGTIAVGAAASGSTNTWATFAGCSLQVTRRVE